MKLPWEDARLERYKEAPSASPDSLPFRLRRQKKCTLKAVLSFSVVGVEASPGCFAVAIMRHISNIVLPVMKALTPLSLC